MNIHQKLEKFNTARSHKVIRIVLMVLICLYPLLSSFWGIDLGDSGYHLYAFENLFKTPELIGFTSYFTTFVGWAWLQVFSGLGVWGLNLLEVLLEIAMAFVVYNTLKNYLGKTVTLVGLLLSVMASDTYLNIFNYHQFNVFWLVLILCFEFKAIEKQQLRYSLAAGICYGGVIFSRMGSVTAIVTCFLYVFWYLRKNKKISYLLKNIGVFLAGTAAMSAVMLLLLTVTGQLSYFSANILRLFGLASASSGGYSMDNLLSTFIEGNLDAIASGAIFLAAFFILFIGLCIIFKNNESIKERIVSVFLGILMLIVAIYQLIYAYDVNPAPSWPQMTTGPAFTIGVLYVLAFLCLCYSLYGGHKRDEIGVIVLMAFILPLLTIAGSNTGTKHVVLGLWIIAPVAVYIVTVFFRSRTLLSNINKHVLRGGLVIRRGVWYLALIIVCVAFLGKFGHMLYYTNNFDSLNRLSLTESIDSTKLKFLKTTEREAEAVNSLLAELNASGDTADRPLIVYGGSIMFYSLTNMPSFTQPWFINGVYDNNVLLEDIEKGYEKFDKLPVVIYCRTNNYYGFEEETYTSLINSQLRSSYGGKREILLDFLEDNDYSLHYANDYYCLIYPPDIAEVDRDYRGYILGTE